MLQAGISSKNEKKMSNSHEWLEDLGYKCLDAIDFVVKKFQGDGGNYEGGDYDVENCSRFESVAEYVHWVESVNTAALDDKYLKL